MEHVADVFYKQPIPLSGVGEGQETRAVWELVVVTTRAGIATLVEELQLASIDGHRLIGVGADQLSVADVVRP